MNILVTGANGFIGKYLIKRLKADGHQVMEHSHLEGDLKQKDALTVYDNIDVIYHLAAKTYVPESWDEPYKYINDNNTMLINVLEYCRTTKAKLVFLSTYLYGEPEYLPVNEKHKCVANTPYHLCKKIGEEICEFYSQNYAVDVVVVRPFNVYGSGQNREFLLPKVYYQVMDPEIKVIEVFNLAPKRDYLYVEDLVKVLSKLLPYIDGYNIYNIGAGKSYSVKEAIDIIQKELHTEKEIVEKYSKRKNEIMDCVADITHLKSTIGSFEITPLSEGIHKWHKKEDTQ